MNDIFVVFGVSGCGKSTIGKQLADHLGIAFYDADDFHPTENVEKMSRGIALDDNDRKGWLEVLSLSLAKWQKAGGAVLACSALKEKYRQKLSSRVRNPHWIFLKGSYELIENRLNERSGHYMGSRLLRSQFDDLEEPAYGLVIDIEKSPKQITEQIISRIKMDNKSVFGVYGLGVMGASLSLNIADKGYELSVFNRAEREEKEVVSDFLRENVRYSNLHGFTDLSDFVESIARPRQILLMIKAGKVVDIVMEQLLPLLSEGDVIIDGGNSHFIDTQRRSEYVGAHGIGFIGAGVSGGEEGARKGPSIMPGGNKEDYMKVAPVLEAIAARDASGNSCCSYVGPDGSGHFIKMVHNGIEYVEMQLLAELYALLRLEKSNEEIARIFEAWNEGGLSSYLLGITVKILKKKEGDHYLLDRVLDRAGNKGTGSWSSKVALDLGVPNGMMTEAVFARYISSFKERREYLASTLSETEVKRATLDVEILKNAYEFARLVNHQQGFQLMAQASSEFNWDLDFQSIARIWSNGCIIKSELMNELKAYFAKNDDLFMIQTIREALAKGEVSVVELLREGLNRRVSLPCFSSAYQFWIDSTTRNLPANLIQAQRDFFGAHTYQRTDDPEGESHHSNWN